MRRLIFGLAVLALSSFVAARPAGNFGYGQQPTFGETHELVKKHLIDKLQDPSSVKDLIIGLPVAGCFERGFGTGRDICGYRICVGFSAKNSAGLYSGRVTHALWRTQGFGVTTESNDDGACSESLKPWDGSVNVELPRFCDRQPKHPDCRNGRTEYYPPSATESAINFTALSGVCLSAFPAAAQMSDDGDKRLSSKGFVNVALVEGGIEYVCSVGLRDRQISRVWADGKSYSYDGFLNVKADIVASDARQRAARIEGFTYKGVSIGDRTKVLDSRLPAYRQSKYSQAVYQFESENCYKDFRNDVEGRAACYESSSFGGVSVSKGSLYIKDGVIQRIYLTIDPNDILKLKLAIVTRYGLPKNDETPIFQNAYGAKYQGTYVEWVYKDTYLTIGSTGKEIASVEIGSIADKEKSAERERERAEKASTDF